MSRAKTPAMPAELDVFGKLYVVRNEPPSGGEAGNCNAETCVIMVTPTHAESAQRDTILHEVVHAVEQELGLKMSERQVAGLATGLLGVMRHNPHLVAYVMGK